jgi:hypothetical protein
VSGQWTYVDVKTTRIQHYITRTPRLKGLRGASAWLSWATDRDRLPAEVLAGHPLLSGYGVEPNPAAGKADGLMSVRFPAGADAAPVARALASDLRATLPSVEISAVWGTGATYLETYRDQLKDLQASPQLLNLPPRSDFPPLASCEECRAAPSIERIGIHEETKWICLDCSVRYDGRYRRFGLETGHLVYRKEARLLTALGLDPDTGIVQHFEELAKLGSADTNRNHLATVYADGNAIGAFLDRVAQHGDPNLKADISAAISAATRESLLAATARALETQSGERLPVIPHIVGGDDLVASVAADRAWPFVTTYLEEFGRRMRSIKGVPPDLLEPVPPTASAGVVFTHFKFPFRRAVELAEGLLRDAKRQHRGAEPAIAWLDVTREGEHAPAGRRAWTLDDLSALGEALRGLREDIEPSGRATLERLVQVEQPEVSAARIGEYGRRLGKADVLAPFLAEATPAERVGRMSDALSLARWWR